MIQDIYPHIYHNEYKPVPPKPQSFVLYYEGDAVLACCTPLVFPDEEAAAASECSVTMGFPRFRDLGPGAAAAAETCVYLFTIDGIGYYLVQEKPQLSPHAADLFTMERIGHFRDAEPLHQSFAGITGHQLKNWYESNKYCGRCGSELEPSEKERMLHCPVCGNSVYPRISPAVIVGVIDGDRLLMTRYSGRAYTSYALIAGFAEIGETIEETVKREVMEEVGIRVKNIRYFGSQPWSFSDTLLLGFYCDLDGSDEIHLDTEELSVGEWLHRSEIPETSGRISLTGTMIERFRRGEE